MWFKWVGLHILSLLRSFWLLLKWVSQWKKKSKCLFVDVLVCVCGKGGLLEFVCVSEWAFVSTKNKEYVLVFEWQDKRVISVLCVYFSVNANTKWLWFCFSKEWVEKVRDKHVFSPFGLLGSVRVLVHGCVCVCVDGDDVDSQNKTSSCFYSLTHKPFQLLSS